MEEEFKMQDESGIKLESIEDYGDNCYHLTFDGRIFDADGGFYDVAQLVVILDGEDLSGRTLSEITDLGKVRLKALLSNLGSKV